MKTRLLYWENTYLLESSAEIIAIGEDDEGKTYFVFDSTIFYPQGGGQPSDTGSIWLGDQCFNVAFAQMVDGVVRHYVEEPTASLCVGKAVALHVDEKRRMDHARMHTAGHLVAIAVSSVCPEWKPVKGHHFPGACYVEFEGALDEDQEVIVERLESVLVNCISQDCPIKARVIDERGTRTVQIGEYPPVLCGGTHVASCSELGGVSVRKIKAKKDRVKVGYAI